MNFIMLKRKIDDLFFVIEVFCIVWFILEYVICFVFSFSKWKFFVLVLNIIDLVLIILFYIILFMEDLVNVFLLVVFCFV